MKDQTQLAKKLARFSRDLQRLLTKYGAYIEMRTIPQEELFVGFYKLNGELRLAKDNPIPDVIDDLTIFEQVLFDEE